MLDCPYKIGPYAYEADSGELHALGQIKRLEPKTSEVLHVLLQNHGRVVSRDQIFAAVWPDQYVVDQALTRCISQIRHALNDKRPHRFVQTLHKRGYRLIAPIDRCIERPL